MEIITIDPMSNNKDLVESFKMVTTRNAFNLYGQRTLIRLVEASQSLIEGKHINDCVKYEVSEDLFGYKRVKMPISAILPDGDKSNYQEAKKKIKALKNANLEYEDNNTWLSVSLLSRVQFDKTSGDALLDFTPEVWQTIMDYSKGFRRYELDIALSLKSTYSIRLYQLLSGQERPLSYKLEELKKMLGVENKYPRPVDFVKRVIIPAKEELDAVAPYSFDFKPILERKNGRGKPGIVGITFYPLFQPKNRDKDLEEQRRLKRYYKPTFELPQGTKNYLMQVYEFTETMLKNNMLLFCSANEHLDLDDFLRDRDFINRARKAKNPQGYVINALKIELKEKGVKV